MNIFNYESTLTQAGMRDTNNLIVGLAPLFQIIRGILFGIILWLIRGSFINKKCGWLIIWILIVIVGIINTPSTAPSSIEYFIYYEPTNTPLNLELGGTLEILVQTFLFSVLSFYALKTKKKV